jgi:hypothetical protein
LYIKLQDNNVVFATHFIRCIFDKKKYNIPFQIENDGVVCYSVEEKQQVENILNNYNITFTTEVLSFTEEQKNKVQGIKYNSRSEAIKHLLEDEEPKDQIIVNLKQENQFLKERLSQTEDVLLTLMFNNV